MRVTTFLVAGAALLLTASCKKSGSDSPTGDSSMQFQIKATNPNVVVNRTTAGSILWTSGTVSASEVKLEAKKNTSEIEYKFTGTHQIDLFASVIASLGSITIPVGTYTEVEFKITLNPSGSGSAMVLNGQYTNGAGVVTPVEFNLNSLFILKAEQNNVNVTGNSSITSLTTLNLSFISNGITLAMMNSATISGGKIMISASSNNNLYNIIINNLQQFHHIDVTHH